jgi:hypothetical protein
MMQPYGSGFSYQPFLEGNTWILHPDPMSSG